MSPSGFSEESLQSLLDFSYSSTLCVRQEDLPEVITMARHLGMWPAVEACSALMKEQEQSVPPGRDITLTCAGARHRCTPRRTSLGFEDQMGDGFSMLLDVSDESVEGSPGHNLRRMPKLRGHNGHSLSPSHRMKLMDFKSPSLKKATTPRNITSTPQNHSPISPSTTRLLRSTPGAAQKVQRMLPVPESPRRNRKSPPAPQISCTSRHSGVCSPVRIKQEVEEVGEDEEDYARAQEKYKLMSVLGLQRTALLPRPDDLIGWRQKKRLRKLKVNNYSLTKRRKPRSAPPVLPYAAVTLSLPLCNPVNSLLLKSVKKSGAPHNTEEPTAKRQRSSSRQVPPSDRSMRSKGTVPDLFQAACRPGVGVRELRRSVRRGDSVHLPAKQPLPPPRRNANRPLVRNTVRIKAEPTDYSISGLPPPALGRRGHTPCKPSPPGRTPARNKITTETVKTLRYNSGRPAAKAKHRPGGAREGEKMKSRDEGRKGQRDVVDAGRHVREGDPGGVRLSELAPPPSIYSHPLYKVIKEEPADPVPVGVPFSDPPSPDLGKRQSKPPIKFLDSGFLFSFCRPPGAPMAGIKKEEESVDICLTRSVSQVGEKFGAEESNHRALRHRGPPAAKAVVKRENEERSISRTRSRRPKPRSRGAVATRTTAKVENMIEPRQHSMKYRNYTIICAAGKCSMVTGN